jgi:hypothetical protein
VQGATRGARERVVDRHGTGSSVSLLVYRARHGIRRFSRYGQYGSRICLAGSLEVWNLYPDVILCHPLTIVLSVALHSNQAKQHKSAPDQEQVFYSVDFRVTMLPILIESKEVAGSIKG